MWILRFNRAIDVSVSYVSKSLKFWAASWQNDPCPAKTPISLGIRLVWSVFAVRSVFSYKGPMFLHADSVDWLDWADAQAGRSLRWAHGSLLVLSRGGSKRVVILFFTRVESAVLDSNLRRKLLVSEARLTADPGVTSCSPSLVTFMAGEWSLISVTIGPLCCWKKGICQLLVDMIFVDSVVNCRQTLLDLWPL